MADQTIKAGSLLEAVEQLRAERDAGNIESEEFRELLMQLNQSWLTPDMTTSLPTSQPSDNNTSPQYEESHPGWSGQSRPKSDEESSNRSFVRNFDWQYQYHSESFELDVPKRLYRYYARRYRTRSFATYIADPFDQGLIRDIIDRLKEFCTDYDIPEDQLHEVARSFVQHFEYASDKVTQGELEYPKFPIETLLHEGGDCEDSSIILGAILRELGYNVAILVLPRKQHMMLGVSFHANIGGACVEHEGEEYTLVETTSPGWDYGSIPPRYTNASVRAYPVSDQPVLVHKWSAEPTGDGDVVIDGHIANFGNAPANKVTAVFYFETERGRAISREKICSIDLLYNGQSHEFSQTVFEPNNEGDVRGRLKLSIDGSLHDVSTSFAR